MNKSIYMGNENVHIHKRKTRSSENKAFYLFNFFFFSVSFNNSYVLFNVFTIQNRNV